VCRNLGVWIDSELSVCEYVSRVAQAYFSICAIYALFVDNLAATFMRD